MLTNIVRTMLAVIKGGLNAFIAPFRIIAHLVRDFLALFSLLGRAVSAIRSYLAFIPSDVLVIIFVMIGIAVFYKVLGREG